MDNLEQNIITNIAQELDCGFDCYFNLKTNEIITIPNQAHIIDDDSFRETFGTDLEKIEQHQPDFIKIEALQSFELFKIMELSLKHLPDKRFKEKLGNILVNKKPFQNFNYLIDNSDFRQDWFNFKQKEIERKVKIS